MSELSPRGRAGAGSRPLRGRGVSRLVDHRLQSQRELASPSDRPSAFGYEVIPERDRVRVATTGELDLLTVPELEATVRELVEAGFRHVIVDLRQAGFLDASGVRALLKLDASARAESAILEVIDGPANVQRVFELTGARARLRFRTPTGDGAIAQNGRGRLIPVRRP